MRLSLIPLILLLAVTAAFVPAEHSSFHLMQIQKVIGGVSGDTSAQAIQLRMRAVGQNLVSGAKMVAYDAAGANPVVVVDMVNDVANSALGSFVLIASAGFSAHTNPPAVADFIMTNTIPESYLAAGSLTFENDAGIVFWRLSWGGASYTGSGAGSPANDADGNFNPPVVGPCPSMGLQALVFLGAATAPSTTNVADYVLTPGPAVFQNNAGASYTVQPPPPLLFDGLVNSALGQATLQTDGDNLTVSNIGSSGIDGVSIDVMGSEGGRVGWTSFADPPLLEDGTAIQIEGVGALEGGGFSSMGQLTATDVGATVQITPDFSPLGATTSQVQIYNAGAHVLTVDGHMGFVTTDAMPSESEISTMLIPYPIPMTPPGPDPFTPSTGALCRFAMALNIMPQGGPTVMGDEIRFLAENPPIVMARIDTVRVSGVIPTGTGMFTITDEAIGVFEHHATGLGSAQLSTSSGGPSALGHSTAPASPCSDCLVISNIGSSGLDGVSIDVGEVEISQSWTWESIGTVNPDSRLDVSAEGTIGGNPGELLGSATIEQGGVGVQITPDYSPIGSATVLLELLLNDVVVFSQSGHTGGIEAPVVPTGCGKLAVPAPLTLCFFFRFDSGTPVTIPGGPTIIADEVRMLGENPGFTYDSLDRLVLKARDIPGNQLNIESLSNSVSGNPAASWDAAHALGGTVVHTNDARDHLTIANIGSSGLDGVSMPLSVADRFRMDFASLGAIRPFEVDSDTFHINIKASGKLTTQPSAEFLGSVSVACVTGYVQVTTDYTPIGATNVLVRLWDDGLIVMEQVLPDGPVLQLPSWITGCGKIRVDSPGGGGGTLCMWIDPGDDVTVTLGGGVPAFASSPQLVNADLIELLAADAPGELEYLSEFGLDLKGIPFILVTNLGDFTPSGINDSPPRFLNSRLHQNYPNPFHSGTNVSFELARGGYVKLQAYSVTGALVGTIFEGSMPAGPHRIDWDGRNDFGRRLASGTYFMRLIAPNQSGETRKFTILR